MKKVLIWFFIILVIILIFPMPHWGTLGWAFIESAIYEYQRDYSGWQKKLGKKANNYWEKCEKDADCFCNSDKAWLQWCYYKSWQIDICKNNICTRWFENN